MATPASDMILALMPIMRKGMNDSNTATGMTVSPALGFIAPGTLVTNVTSTKSDGTYTYFASDIAYHRSKLERIPK